MTEAETTLVDMVLSLARAELAGWANQSQLGLGAYASQLAQQGGGLGSSVIKAAQAVMAERLTPEKRAAWVQLYADQIRIRRREAALADLPLGADMVKVLYAEAEQLAKETENDAH